MGKNCRSGGDDLACLAGRADGDEKKQLGSVASAAGLEKAREWTVLQMGEAIQQV